MKDAVHSSHDSLKEKASLSVAHAVFEMDVVEVIAKESFSVFFGAEIEVAREQSDEWQSDFECIQVGWYCQSWRTKCGS